MFAKTSLNDGFLCVCFCAGKIKKRGNVSRHTVRESPPPHLPTTRLRVCVCVCVFPYRGNVGSEKKQKNKNEKINDAFFV